MDARLLIKDFLRAAQLAGVALAKSDIEVEILPAPHRPPKRLPVGKLAVYVFSYGDIVLKVGKVGTNSGPRYTSQHYNAASAPSTLAATLLIEGNEIGVPGLTVELAGDWIKKNTTGTNFLLQAKCGVPTLSLLEAFLHCRLKPGFEGVASQR